MRKTLKTENHVKELCKDWYVSVGGWSYGVIQNGLGVHGIPDRVGVVPVVITLDMVGKTFGQFTAIECKRPGRRGEPDRGMKKHQVQRAAEINAAGGIAVCCDGYEDLAALHQRVYQMELPI